MEKASEKKGILERLTGRAKAKKSPCCGGFVIEKAPEPGQDGEKDGESPKDDKPCCCR